MQSSIINQIKPRASTPQTRAAGILVHRLARDDDPSGSLGMLGPEAEARRRVRRPSRRAQTRGRLELDLGPQSDEKPPSAESALRRELNAWLLERVCPE